MGKGASPPPGRARRHFVRDKNVGALASYRKLGLARLPEPGWQSIPPVSLLTLHRTVEISATP